MLFLVPTPIGNLEDITLRAVRVLKEADVIVCEDTRHTQKLLTAHHIHSKGLLSFHDHSGPGRLAEIMAVLAEKKTVALVTDGGTPLISDPGFEVVRAAVQAGHDVSALPGPSALVTALSASGLAVDAFSFFGFPPPKSAARKNWLSRFKDREETLIFYESPYRAGRSLADMRTVFGDREAVVARELTKKFEEYARGTLKELAQKFGAKEVLGEIVILVSGKGRKRVLK